MKMKSILLSFFLIVTSGMAYASFEEYTKACQKIEKSTSAEIAATLESIKDFLKENDPARAASYRGMTDRQAKEALLGVCDILYDRKKSK